MHSKILVNVFLFDRFFTFPLGIKGIKTTKKVHQLVGNWCAEQKNQIINVAAVTGENDLFSV